MDTIIYNIFEKPKVQVVLKHFNRYVFSIYRDFIKIVYYNRGLGSKIAPVLNHVFQNLQLFYFLILQNKLWKT